MDAFIDTVARTFWVDHWVSEMEEQGREFSGGADLFDLAPPTPEEAYNDAYRFSGALEQANGTNIHALIFKAQKAAGATEETMDDIEESFGFLSAMEALGHGVSWDDDYPSHGIEIPYFHPDWYPVE